MKVYLAGPDVFLSDAKAIGRRKKEICARFGIVGLFPFHSEIDEAIQHVTPPAVRLFRGCTAMMEDADAVIAHLTPFRGPSADVGTIFELGYMAARGKICAGYSNRRDRYIDRIERAPSVSPDGDGLVNLDCEGHVIENFGLPDNLMVVQALEAFGHPLMVPDAEPADIWRDLVLFEKCVDWVARQRPKAAAV
jgi:nucleoside 2-deoxyribosyltransferase